MKRNAKATAQLVEGLVREIAQAHRKTRFSANDAARAEAAEHLISAIAVLTGKPTEKIIEMASRTGFYGSDNNGKDTFFTLPTDKE